MVDERLEDGASIAEFTRQENGFLRRGLLEGAVLGFAADERLVSFNWRVRSHRAPYERFLRRERSATMSIFPYAEQYKISTLLRQSDN
ncbi:hypothetical protein [Methylosinus sp. R-45379]|uniref:hypothetical protein n=1 Tax=Methylosinus sp. R-45379 TaxID=980563 RepID=UPI000A90CC0C|nr:hypothetical protein [Methylosinus sp. R-45379]